MGLRLAPHLSFCLVDGQPVFLDLGRDRYFGLSRAAAAGFERLIRSGGDDCGGEMLAVLLAAGILEPTDSPDTPRPVEVDPCDRSFVSNGAPPASRLALLAALAWQIRAGCAVRRLPLSMVVERLADIQARPRRAHMPAEVIVDAHRRADLWLSPHDRCLAKSVALLAHLRRHGADARLVFGVALRPFAAHCWVQSDGMVLNGDLEEVRLFKPILAI